MTTAAQGAINVKSGGTLDMTGGRITTTSTKQSIYNEGGVVRISGSAYLSSKAALEGSNKRGTVQCLTGTKLTITGGTIISTYATGIAVSSAGTLTIGTDDGNVSIQNSVMQGTSYGVYSTGNFKLYDGIMKGTVAGIYGTVNTMDANSSLNSSGHEIIGSLDYHTAYLE